MMAERAFLLYYLLITGLFLFHNDLGWHLATGDYIRQIGSIPKTDPWSFTADNQPWINFSWGWDVLASFIHERTGLLGLQVITACMGAAIIGIQTSVAVRMGAALVPTIITVFIAGIALPQFSPPDVFLAITPQVITLVFLAIFHFVLWDSLHKNLSQQLLLLPLIIFVWANMHGGFILGFVVLGFYILDAVFAKNSKQIRILLLVLFLCVIASSFTPWGDSLIPTVIEFMQHPSKRGISEWQSVWQRFEGKTDIPAIVYLLMFVPALFGAVRAKNIPAAMFLICLVTYVQAWFQIRYISVFIVFSIPFMAWGLSQIRSESLRSASIKISNKVKYSIVLLSMVSVSLMILLHMDKRLDLPDVRWPKEEISFVQKQYPDRNLINHWNYGSYIIYQTRGRLKPFIDGRAETAYPLSLFENFAQMYHTQDWTDVIKIYNIGVVIWPKIDTKMLHFFEGNPHWSPVFEGRLAVVYAKQ